MSKRWSAFHVCQAAAFICVSMTHGDGVPSLAWFIGFLTLSFPGGPMADFLLPDLWSVCVILPIDGAAWFVVAAFAQFLLGPASPTGLGLGPELDRLFSATACKK
jgi:hypothetical protein